MAFKSMDWMGSLWGELDRGKKVAWDIGSLQMRNKEPLQKILSVFSNVGRKRECTLKLNEKKIFQQ